MTTTDRPRTADVAAFFDGARLTLARQLAGLRKSDLAQLLDMSPTAVAAWESGAKRPTAVTVARLALSLSVDPGFFAMRPDDVAALSATPHFRSLRSTTQLARDQAFAYGQLAVDIADQPGEARRVPRPGRAELPGADGRRGGDLDCGEAGTGRAQRVRERWGMSAGPGAPPRPPAGKPRCPGGVQPAQAAGVDAYSFDSRLRPVVVLNPVKHDYYRQRFDVAHELGHLVMHTDAEPGGGTVEEQANRFAAEFLMPAAADPRRAAEGHERRRLAVTGPVQGALGDQPPGAAVPRPPPRRVQRGLLPQRHGHPHQPRLAPQRAGLVTILEQPSMLPRALELLAAEGISSCDLRDQCRVPAELFRTVTSRRPQPPPPDAAAPAECRPRTTPTPGP